MKTKLFHWVNGDYDHGLQNVVLRAFSDERERIVREITKFWSDGKAWDESCLEMLLEYIKPRSGQKPDPKEPETQKPTGAQWYAEGESYFFPTSKERKPLERLLDAPSNCVTVLAYNLLVDAINELRSPHGKD